MLWAINASPQPKSATTWEDGLQSKLSKNNKITHLTLSSWTPHYNGHLPKNGHLQYIHVHVATDWCSLHKRCFIIQARQMWHFAWSVRWGEKKKIKCLLPGPLFWLFHPSTPTNIDWWQWCQKDQWKHDSLLENCHLSAYQKHWQQHKPKQITTTRAWITFNNVRVSAAKIRFAQSNFSLCPNTAARKSSGKTIVQRNSKHYHEVMSYVLPVNT